MNDSLNVHFCLWKIAIIEENLHFEVLYDQAL